MTNGNFDAEHTAVYHCQSAARYFAMAWAANGPHWAVEGRTALANVAELLGYKLVPLDLPTADAGGESEAADPSGGLLRPVDTEAA